ncbi:MAG: hypothetical protein EKK46_00345 [Rhodocyclaceae bacterium]|nr:MAG: hypothetical protein EKK46_00345 [Rhodocyclaceae bacterium]
MTEASTTDFLDIGDEALYFDETAVAGTESLIAEASVLYGEADAEAKLLRAYFLAPEQLSVLVALYRYYFYQHRLEDTLIVAGRALAASANRLEMPADWRGLSPATVAQAGARNMGLLRFYLLALKGTTVVLLRLGRIVEARERLEKLLSLDDKDHLGAAALLAVVKEAQAESLLRPTLTLVAA